MLLVNSVLENPTAPELLKIPKSDGSMVHVVLNNHNSDSVKLPKLYPQQDKFENWLQGLKGLQPNSLVTCIFCKGLFTVGQVAQHVNLKHTVFYNCEECGMSFTNRTALAVHKTTHEDTRNYECGVCCKRFQSKRNLNRHERNRGEEREWVCHICNASFNNYKCYFVMHIQSHSNTTVHQCNFCEKKFSCASLFNRHVQNTHATNLKCNVCNEVFPSYYYLQKHSNVHKDPVREVCPICQKEFNAKYLAAKHMKTVHGNKEKFVCDMCGKTCSNSTSLRDHKNIHLGIKPVQCHDCGKVFTKKGQLHVHQLVHSGLKPHSCKMCDKKFTQRSSLIIHMRSHTGERPYKCELCDAAFVSRTVLNNHKKKHRIV